jgi:acetoin utilization deacetylase AcuC-like enzyme
MSRPLRAFYHPDQACHDPQQSMRYGRVIPAKDLPIRTEKLLGALKARGIAPERPAEGGLAAAAKVHTPAYLTFLQTVWERWAAVPNHGPEVWPNYFPYWNGRPEEHSRPPCPAEHLVGQVGWYLGDLSAPMGPRTWLSALRSCETALSAADALMAGEETVYALCRPSGHHARTDRAAGACYLNNTAIAAERLRRRYGRIAILDVDVHHGDGTQQIFYNRGDVLTVSIHADPANAYPYFTGYAGETGNGRGEGYNLNLPLAVGSGGEAMAAAVESALTRIRAHGAEALVLAVGFDAHRDDPVRLLGLEASDFGAIGRRVGKLGLPTLVVQEGGYAIDAIAGCLGAFLAGLDSGGDVS